MVDYPFPPWCFSLFNARVLFGYTLLKSVVSIRLKMCWGTLSNDGFHMFSNISVPDQGLCQVFFMY